MYNVKIFGAGSIGNHLAHASRSLGLERHHMRCGPSGVGSNKTNHLSYSLWKMG